MTVQPSVALTDRFVRAIEYARIAHAARGRNRDVTSLVIELGAVANMAIAAIKRMALPSVTSTEFVEARLANERCVDAWKFHHADIRRFDVSRNTSFESNGQPHNT